MSCRWWDMQYDPDTQLPPVSSMANIGSANSLAAGLIVLTSSALLLPLDSCCLTIGTVYSKKLIYIMLLFVVVVVFCK